MTKITFYFFSFVFLLDLIIPHRVYASRFTKQNENINGYDAYYMSGNLRYDRDTIESINDLINQSKPNAKKTNILLIIDSGGGDIGLENDLVDSTLLLAKKRFQTKHKPMIVSVVNSCYSLCTIFLIQLRSKISTLGLEKKILLKVNTKAEFGFHGANQGLYWSRSGTTEMIKKMIQFGISSEWLTLNYQVFNELEVTIFNSEELAANSSGWVLKKELY